MIRLPWKMKQAVPIGPGIPAAPAALERIASYSMAGTLVLRSQFHLACDVHARGIPGDFVECGVYNGGSAAAVACAFRDTSRAAWLYDSFEGLPESTARDGEEAKKWTGGCHGSVEAVFEAMALADFPRERCVIRKGWFQETFKEELPERIALLHVDADWYESAILCLRTFYDRVSDGGVILLDDFGCWEGCREAFYDFVQERGLKPLCERFGFSQMFWVKGRTNNRECRAFHKTYA
jgi:O-methyltransferase